MKNKKKFSLILVFVLIAAMFSEAYMPSMAVSQEDYDKAQEEAKAAREATEAKRNEAKNAAKKAAAAVANFEEAEKREGLSCIIPLKSNSKLIARYGLDEPVERLNGFSRSTVLYKKVRMANGKWLYAFRDTRSAFEQETGYIERASKRKGGMDSEKYSRRKAASGSSCSSARTIWTRSPSISLTSGGGT